MRRVAITGMGVVSPVGIGTKLFFKNLLQSRSGIGPVDFAQHERLRMRLGAQVREFRSTHNGSRRGTLDRFSEFALVAAREAWQQAKLASEHTPEYAPENTGVYFGTGFGGATTLEAGYTELFVKNQNRVHPYSVLAAMPNAAAANIAIELGIRGPCFTYAVACASSAVAIGEAFRAIQSGAISVALAGGAEAPLSLVIMKAWEGLMALAVEDKAHPVTSCRPFARDRTGLVLGEGAGALVLEELDHALARGATVLAEMAGYGITNDATHLSKPDASGQTQAMSNALKEARRHDIAPHDIAYLNAHGTATKVGDKVETDSIKATYGDHATRLPISSTKALHGHLLGAAGVVEFIAAIEAMRHAIAPPTAHLWQADPECDLDYIPLAPRPLHNPRAVMSNSFAFGGSNAVLVAKRVC